MANELKLSNAAANAQADALARLLDGGYLRIYSGTKPSNADTATAETLLAELRYSNPSAPAASAGVLTMSAITKDSSARASGAAAWFRSMGSDGTTVVLDGTVGTAGCDLNLNSVNIAVGAEVSVSAFTHTVAKG